MAITGKRGTMTNDHVGSTFDSYLAEVGIEVKEEKVKSMLNAYKKLYSEHIADIGDLPSVILWKDENGNWIELRKNESEVQE